MIVFISSTNEKAHQYCRMAIDAGHTPIAPSYTHFVTEEKSLEMSLHLLDICDELWMFGKPTCTMQMELDYARDNFIPYRLFPEEN